jgi:hypothetical protein
MDAILAWLNTNWALTLLGIVAAYIALHNQGDVWAWIKSKIGGLWPTVKTHSTDADALAAAYATLEPILAAQTKEEARRDVTAAIANLMLPPISAEVAE